MVYAVYRILIVYYSMGKVKERTPQVVGNLSTKRKNLKIVVTTIN
jgi:hypothetical protein